MRINNWLTRATSRLSEAGVPSSRLDARLILAHTLDVTPTWLVAHADDNIEDKDLIHHANTLLTKRIHRMPLAYLTGTKEFYGRDFMVNEHVLIPRPETETMIDLIKKYMKGTKTIDVGCGSGCIGITAALEMPSLDVTLSDISSEALTVALQNARTLGANITAVESDLLASIDAKFDAIFANLPYVDREWERSPETKHEPAQALFAENHGLAVIDALITQVPSHLHAGGHLFLEADPLQHRAIAKTGASHGLRLVEADDYIVVLQQS